MGRECAPVIMFIGTSSCPGRSVDDDHHQRRQQQYRSCGTPTRSPSSTTPRRSVPFARDGRTKQALSSSSTGIRGARAAADVPRIQIRAKCAGDGGGGRGARPEAPWGWGGVGGATPPSSTLTPPPRTFSALHKEGAGGGLHQQQRLSSRSPRSSLSRNHIKNNSWRLV
jgi:hypothetical protein